MTLKNKHVLVIDRGCVYNGQKTSRGYLTMKRPASAGNQNAKGTVWTKEAREKRSKMYSGDKNPNWRGGRRFDKDGYVLIYNPSHPMATSDGYMLEHRLVMEKEIGRYLTRGECPHHINGIKNDNRIENLELMSLPIHMSLHTKGKPRPWLKGKNISKEHANKISIALKGKKKSPEHRAKIIEAIRRRHGGSK